MEPSNYLVSWVVTYWGDLQPTYNLVVPASKGVMIWHQPKQCTFFLVKPKVRIPEDISLDIRNDGMGNFITLCQTCDVYNKLG